MKQNNKEIEEDFMALNEDEICARCNKNKATLIYTNSQMDFIHGFTEKICQECYDEQMKESNWYKEGKQQTLKEVIKMIDDWFENEKLHCKPFASIYRDRWEEMKQKLKGVEK